MMARYPVKQPPEGYLVVFDAKMKRYYPLQRAKGRGHAADGWDYIADDEGKHVSYAKRWQAVEFCERKASESI